MGWVKLAMPRQSYLLAVLVLEARSQYQVVKRQVWHLAGKILQTLLCIRRGDSATLHPPKATLRRTTTPPSAVAAGARYRPHRCHFPSSDAHPAANIPAASKVTRRSTIWHPWARASSRLAQFSAHSPTSAEDALGASGWLCTGWGSSEVAFCVKAKSYRG